MKCAMLALDVDGTLLNDDYVLTERTKEAVRMAHQAGAQIVLCTGRSPINAIPIMQQLGLEGVVITHNGALTVETKTRAVRNRFAFNIQQVASVIEYSREKGIQFDTCTDFEMYNEGATAEAADIYEKFLVNPIVVPDLLQLAQSVVKFTLFDASETMDEVERIWEQLDCQLTKLRSHARFIDVMHPQATKGNALEQLAMREGIEHEQIIAIGNYFNDVEMIRYAGLGIAMDNAPQGVKNAADAITGSNNGDGIRDAIIKYVLGETR